MISPEMLSKETGCSLDLAAAFLELASSHPFGTAASYIRGLSDGARGLAIWKTEHKAALLRAIKENDDNA